MLFVTTLFRYSETHYSETHTTTTSALPHNLIGFHECITADCILYNGAAMFGRQRPVPSKAALKVLYQLAYISSGTAIGVATLCAEERRRRTALLQKIADNAKRIRQSPRYVHNKAAAAVVDDTKDEHVPLQGAARHDVSAQAARDVLGEELPCQVEAGYEQLTRRGLSASLERRHRGRKVPPRPQPAGEKDDFLGEDTFMAPAPKGEKDDSTAAPERARARWFETVAQRTKITPRSTASLSRQRPNFRHAIVREALDSGKLPEEQVPGVRTADALQHDLRVFLEDSAWADETGNEARDEIATVGSALLKCSLKYGSLDDVALLLQRSDVRRRLTSYHDFAMLREKCRLSSSSKYGLEYRNRLFVFLFRAEGFRALPQDSQAHLIVAVLGDLLRLPTEGEPRPHARVKEVLSACETIVDRKAMAAKLRQKCRSLISHGYLARAADLVMAAGHKVVGFDPQSYHWTRDMVIWAAINGNWITHASALLRFSLMCDTKHFDPGYEKFRPQLDEVLRQCGDSKDSESDPRVVRLWASLGEKNSPPLTMSLSVQSRVILLKACASSYKTTPRFRKLYRALRATLPLEILASVELDLGPYHLRWLWSVTRNIDKVRREYDELKARHSGSVRGQSALALIDLALAEIYAVAQKFDLAQRALGTTWKDGSMSSLDDMLVAAVTLSEQCHWTRLRALIKLMRSLNVRLREDDVRGRDTVNRVLLLFDGAHAVSETSLLVKELMEFLGFRPNAVTMRIIFQRVVTDGQPRDILEWLTFFRNLGYSYSFDGHMANKLLLCFETQYRPTHRQVMNICERLVRETSVLKPWHFEGTVRKAIVDDMKGLDVNDKADLRRLALANLEGMSKAPGATLLPKGTSIRTPLSQMSDSDDEVDLKEHQANSEEHRQNRPSSFLQFADLRPGFEATQDEHKRGRGHHWVAPGDVIQRSLSLALTGVDKSQHRWRIEQPMVLALSSGHNQAVLDIYEASLDSDRLPLSPLSLEIATEARIRRDGGHVQGAQRMLDEAHEAGFNITCAMGPIIVHTLYHMSKNYLKDLRYIRTIVTEYYRLNHENGWRVKHHVGVVAANVLINAGEVISGLSILDEIHNSRWAQQRPLEIQAMTVYLKGYTKHMKSDNILGVITHVLKEDIRIDRAFLKQLKTTIAVLKRAISYRNLPPHHPMASFAALLREHYEICSQRRLARKQRAREVGLELQDVIIQCVNQTKEQRTWSKNHLDSEALKPRADEQLQHQPLADAAEDYQEMGSVVAGANETDDAVQFQPLA